MKGKCLKCGKEYNYDFIPPQKTRNKMTCYTCRKIKRLKAKANKRGLKKNTYLQ